MGNKIAQEEMVGFALIMIIVAVIILVFVALSITSPQQEGVNSYEVESFLQALLQKTTDCYYNSEYVSVQSLILRCKNKAYCDDERSTCEVLNTTLKEETGKFWTKQEGYRLVIGIGEGIMVDLKEGNVSNTYKGAVQRFSVSGETLQISFKAYS